jgi:hypothetical protein
MVFAQIGNDCFCDIGDLVAADPRPATEPEAVVHDLVCIGKVTDHPILYPLEGWLIDDVAAEKQPRTDPHFLQVREEIAAVERTVVTNGQEKTEPGRFRIRRRLGKNEMLVEARFTERLCILGNIVVARGNEAIDLVQLAQPDSRLHVSCLQIIGKVRIDEFVIVAVG